MARSTEEWIADNDDQAIPARVKLRVFERYRGRCAECTLRLGGKLLPQFDHIIALINGGQHRESNLRCVCSECHKPKTKSDVAEKSKFAERQKKRLKLKRRRTIPGRHFDGRPIPSRWVD